MDKMDLVEAREPVPSVKKYKHDFKKYKHVAIRAYERILFSK